MNLIKETEDLVEIAKQGARIAKLTDSFVGMKIMSEEEGDYILAHIENHLIESNPDISSRREELLEPKIKHILKEEQEKMNQIVSDYAELYEKSEILDIGIGILTAIPKNLTRTPERIIKLIEESNLNDGDELTKILETFTNEAESTIH